MSPKFWNSDKIVSFAAMFISLCTLFVFVYQTELIRKQQYLSVYPHLSIGNMATGSTNYKFLMKNDGIGPAMIKSVEVKYKDTVYQKDLAWYLQKVVSPEDSINYYYANVFLGQLIPANEIIEIVGFSGDNLFGAKRLHELLHEDDFDFIIEYESIYGQRWRVTHLGPELEQLK